MPKSGNDMTLKGVAGRNERLGAPDPGHRAAGAAWPRSLLHESAVRMLAACSLILLQKIQLKLVTGDSYKRIPSQKVANRDGPFVRLLDAAS